MLCFCPVVSACLFSVFGQHEPGLTLTPCSEWPVNLGQNEDNHADNHCDTSRVKI